MHLPQSLLYRLQEIFIRKTQAISERRAEEECLVLLTLNSSKILGEKCSGRSGRRTQVGAAGGCVPSPVHCPGGIIKYDVAFVQLKDAKVPR